MFGTIDVIDMTYDMERVAELENNAALPLPCTTNSTVWSPCDNSGAVHSTENNSIWLDIVVVGISQILIFPPIVTTTTGVVPSL